MKRPIRRVALYGYLGSGNIGNDASLETVLAWLQSAYPDVEVRCITIAPREVTARYGIPSMPLVWHSSGHSGNRVTDVFRRLFGRSVDAPAITRWPAPWMQSLSRVWVCWRRTYGFGRGVCPWSLSHGGHVSATSSRPFVLLDVGAEWAVNPLTRRLYRRRRTLCGARELPRPSRRRRRWLVPVLAIPRRLPLILLSPIRPDAASPNQGASL